MGLKSQWFDNRLQLNLSAFLMKWDDIQIRFTSTSEHDDGAFWIEGNINGGKAEQKGVEFNGEWQATERLNFPWSAFLASPEFTEDTLVPNSDEVYIAKGSTMPVSPKEKYWASVEYTFPDFLPLRAISGRGSRTAGRARPGTACDIEDSKRDPDDREALNSCSRMEVRHLPARLHQRQRLGRGAHRPQRLRRRGYQLAEQHLATANLRRPTLALHARSAAAAKHTTSRSPRNGDGGRLKRA